MSESTNAECAPLDLDAIEARARSIAASPGGFESAGARHMASTDIPALVAEVRRLLLVEHELRDEIREATLLLGE